MDLQLLEGVAKYDELNCNYFSKPFIVYSFALFSTEEYQSLSSQNQSFFWRSATARFRFYKLLLTPCCCFVSASAALPQSLTHPQSELSKAYWK